VTNALDNPKRHCIGFLKIRRVETENIPRQRTRTNHGSRYQSSRSWRSQIVTFLWRARQAKMGTKESTSDLGSQVLQNSCKIDRCTGSHTFRVLPCLQKPRNPPHRKLKTRLLRPGHCLWSLCLPPPSSTCSCSCRGTHLSLSLSKKDAASLADYHSHHRKHRLLSGKPMPHNFKRVQRPENSTRSHKSVLTEGNSISTDCALQRAREENETKQQPKLRCQSN
jgi:hypothetical protein